MSLSEQIKAFPLQVAQTAGGPIAYRRAGSPGSAVWVLLHGIGSASGSWLAQLQAAQNLGLQVLAWDAPGYGQSAPVGPAHPMASDYAVRLWAWLDAMGCDRVNLVGHSLGCLGYGLAEPAVRQSKLKDRLDKLQSLGTAGMAAERAPAMLSASASADQLAWVAHTMAHVIPAGYTQASYMLAAEDLATLVQGLQLPIDVACGQADRITPAQGCAQLAAQLRVPFHLLGDVGHACPLEAAQAVNELLFSPTGGRA
ncbi:MAG: alpha/beta hydrolase [Betaproteobacteria bacterium]|nr:alpha/beta hydrolase [Betaproteobacteria bacterium]